jgi:AcrR family transcriptional regulator
MNEIGFSKINVTKIIGRAGINRNTFYSHYLNKYDLLDKVADELLDGFRIIAADAPVGLLLAGDYTDKPLTAYLTRLINCIHENGEIFMLLIGDKGDPSVMGKLKEQIFSVWAERDILDRFVIPQDYVFAAQIALVIGLIEEWVKRGYQESPEEFGRIVMAIMKGIPQNILKKQ